MGRKAKQIDEAAFAADVHTGLNTRQLGEKYGIAWQTAKTPRDGLVSGGAAGPEEAKQAKDDASEETHLGLDISIRKDRMTATLEKIDDEEIAAAVLLCDADTQAMILAAVVQRRLDAELEEDEAA